MSRDRTPSPGNRIRNEIRREIEELSLRVKELEGDNAQLKAALQLALEHLPPRWRSVVKRVAEGKEPE